MSLKQNCMKTLSLVCLSLIFSMGIKAQNLAAYNAAFRADTSSSKQEKKVLKKAVGVMAEAKLTKTGYDVTGIIIKQRKLSRADREIVYLEKFEPIMGKNMLSKATSKRAAIAIESRWATRLSRPIMVLGLAFVLNDVYNLIFEDEKKETYSSDIFKKKK